MQDLLHSFPAQEPNEPVFVFARPFWLAFVPTILIFGFVFLLSALAQVYVSGQPGGLNPYIANITVIGIGVFQLAVLLFFLVAVLDFYFDLLILTDRRIVDINQEQLFYRKISELNLRDIEDTSFIRKGFFQTYFNFGKVTIQTAGERENFEIDHLRYPAEIAMLISDLAEQAKDNDRPEDRFPDTKVVGVIEGRLITDPDDLVIVGAMLPEDARRTHP